MTEILFYHMHQPIEKALPALLEKTLQRGWKAVVCVGNEERMAALDESLWTYREDSFLPHGTERDGDAERQPVLLTVSDTAPNRANVLFLVENAPAEALLNGAGYDRIVLMFDGNDEEQIGKAREDWKKTRAAKLDATYWQQSELGSWEKKA